MSSVHPELTRLLNALDVSSAADAHAQIEETANELAQLRAENAKLRAVAEAARDVLGDYRAAINTNEDLDPEELKESEELADALAAALAALDADAAKEDPVIVPAAVSEYAATCPTCGGSGGWVTGKCPDCNGPGLREEP